MFHSTLVPRPHVLTPTQRKELAIKQAAFRIAAGMESRSLRELAEEIGCTHQAIHNVLLRLCERLGIHRFMKTPQHRANLRAARARVLARSSHIGS